MFLVGGIVAVVDQVLPVDPGHTVGQLGRRRIAHIAGGAADSAATGREQGLPAALAEAGLPPATGTLRGDWSRAWVDAVFCGNDQIALG